MGWERVSRTDRVVLRAASAGLSRLPSGAGQFRVADRLHARICARYPPETLLPVTLREGAKALLDLNDYVEARVAIVWHWQPAVTRFLIDRLSAGGVFVDVGAHVGIISLAVGAGTLPARLQIHAFEPLERNVERLRTNAALNPDIDLRIVHSAVGAKRGELLLATPDPRVPSMGYVVDDEADEPAMRVPVTPLDDYAADSGIDFIDAIKIDVEGFEASVLAGAARLLRERRVGAVICELNEGALSEHDSSTEELVATFAEAGYRRHPLPFVGLSRWTRGRLGSSFDDAIFLPSGGTIPFASCRSVSPAC